MIEERLNRADKIPSVLKEPLASSLKLLLLAQVPPLSSAFVKTPSVEVTEQTRLISSPATNVTSQSLLKVKALAWSETKSMALTVVVVVVVGVVVVVVVGVVVVDVVVIAVLVAVVVEVVVVDEVVVVTVCRIQHKKHLEKKRYQ